MLLYVRMRKYRLTLLLKSVLSKEKKDKLIADVKNWIGDLNNASETTLGEKKLKYAIANEKSAEFHIINFEAEKITPELDKKLRMEENILRHLLIRMD